MEREVFYNVNGKISVLKAKKEQHQNDMVWNVYDQSEVIARLVRSADYKGLQVWGSRIPTSLTQEQMYWIGIQLNAA